MQLKSHTLWISNILAILSLSYWGRDLQGLLMENFNRAELAGIIFSAFIFFVGLIYYLLYYQQNPTPPLLLTLFFLACFLVLPFALETIEERTHILLFASLGILLARRFKFHIALLTALAVGAGDEVFQYFLPNRVGDIRDVLFNWTSALTGLLFFYAIRWNRRKTRPCNQQQGPDS